MSTRKSRKKLAPKVDLLKPLLLQDIFKLGSKDDPCFGKLYDPKHETCRRCGDMEVCAIACGQALHTTRNEVEQSTNFLDMEEKEIDAMSPAKKARKLIRRLCKNHKQITIQNLKTQVLAGTGLEEKQFDKVLKRTIEGMEGFEIKNNSVKAK